MLIYRPIVLFNDGDLSQELENNTLKVSQNVDTILENKFSIMSDDAIIDELEKSMRIDPIELKESERVMKKDKNKIDVSKDRNRGIINRNIPFYIPSIVIKISIPFKGDPKLWILRPNLWKSTFPRGIIKNEYDNFGDMGGILELVFEQAEDIFSEKRIKESYDNIMEEINFYLNTQKEQLNSANAALPELIRTSIAKRREELKKYNNLSDMLGIPIEAPKKKSLPLTNTFSLDRINSSNINTSPNWDVFISHASEDKEEFARPLANALIKRGLQVWFDEFTLRVGDSLRRSIDMGLSKSKYGVVIISKSFLEKEWPQKELDGLVAREINGQKVILPVWHNIDSSTIIKYSPTLADRVAASSSKGLMNVVEELISAMDDL